jgi:hypothetical protein
MFVSYGPLMPLKISDIREIGHDIKSADVSRCFISIFVRDLRREIIVSNHVDCLTCSRGVF